MPREDATGELMQPSELYRVLPMGPATKSEWYEQVKFDEGFLVELARVIDLPKTLWRPKSRSLSQKRLNEKLPAADGVERALSQQMLDILMPALDHLRSGDLEPLPVQPVVFNFPCTTVATLLVYAHWELRFFNEYNYGRGADFFDCDDSDKVHQFVAGLIRSSLMRIGWGRGAALDVELPEGWAEEMKQKGIVS